MALPSPRQTGSILPVTSHCSATDGPLVRSAALPLNKWAWALSVAVHDRVCRHIGERLDRQRRIKARLRREVRAADHEQVGNVPALTVLVDDRSLRIAAHAYAALV